MSYLNFNFNIWYIFYMNQESSTEFGLYQISLNTLMPATASIFMAFIILNSQTLVIQLSRPALLVIGFIISHAAICILSEALTQRLARRFSLNHPTIVLWLYPAIALFLITISAYGFLVLSNLVFGRGFWSSWLGLTGQDTTTLFFTCFVSMLLFIAIQFTLSVLKVFNWIVETSKNHLDLAAESLSGNAETINQVFADISSRSEHLKQQRLNATRTNRKALLISFLFCTFFGFWIVFFRPELVLYYRAEIQLKTFIEPQAAYNTFQHLTERFPDYRFVDSVFYRMAWILDRRLNEYQKASNEYELFLKRFGYNNIWSDEALTALVRLHSDKLNDPAQALKWSELYLKTNPDGVMAPHMHLYRIRSYSKLSQHQEAEAELRLAEHRFAGKKIQIINSEDRLIAFTSFSEALKAEKN